MNEFSTYEYVVAQKSEGKYRWRKIGMILLYVFYVITFFTVGAATAILVPCIALIPVTTWILVFLTWRYVEIEYEYSITSGVLTFTKIYGGRTRKTVTEIKIKDASVIAPFSDRLQESRFEAFRASKVYSALSSLYAEDAYFMLYVNEKNERCAFAFEATAQALKICKFYNPAATIVKQVKY
jgi:hypothetical protein